MRIIEDQHWDNITGNPDLNAESKRDLLEFVLAFAGLAPDDPSHFAKWSNETFRDSALAQTCFEAAGATAMPVPDGSPTDEKDEPQRALSMAAEAQAGRGANEGASVERRIGTETAETQQAVDENRTARARATHRTATERWPTYGRPSRCKESTCGRTRSRTRASKQTRQAAGTPNEPRDASPEKLDWGDSSPQPSPGHVDNDPANEAAKAIERAAAELAMKKTYRVILADP